MSRFMLVPENFNLDEIKEISLPSKLYQTTTSRNETPPRQNKTPKNQTCADSQMKTEKKIRAQYLSPTVIQYAFNQARAKKLLKFMKEKQFKYDKSGRLVFRNKVYPILLEASFLDLVNDARKSKKIELFYNLLSENGFDKTLLSKSKQKYFN